MRPWLYSNIMMQADNCCYKKLRKYFLTYRFVVLLTPRHFVRDPLCLRKEGEEEKKNRSLRSREGAGGELTNKADILSPLL